MKRAPQANPLEVKASADADLAPFSNIKQVVTVMRDAVDKIMDRKRTDDDRQSKRRWNLSGQQKSLSAAGVFNPQKNIYSGDGQGVDLKTYG